MDNHKLLKLLKEETLDIIKRMSSLDPLSYKKVSNLTFLYINRINAIINHYQEANLTNFNILMIMESLLMEGFLTREVLKLLIETPADKRPIILEQLDQANYLGN